MAGQIEKMHRMRKNILRGVLIGSIIAFGVFMYPTFFFIFRKVTPLWSYRYLEGALILWLLVLLIFITRYLLYKKKLRKDPSLRAAVNDERVRLNWLKAYRFAFFTATGITIVWKWCESSFSHELLMGKFHLPNGPFLILYVALISLIGSFLYYNREVKDG
jgi:MFS family permease